MGIQGKRLAISLTVFFSISLVLNFILNKQIDTVAVAAFVLALTAIYADSKIGYEFQAEQGSFFES